MKKEDLLFSSLFAIFIGFLIFMFSIMNKDLKLLNVVITYYVLFLLLGLIIMLIGFILLLVWHVSNRKPYDEGEEKRGFYGYLAAGIFFLTTGFLYMFYFHDRNRSLYYLFIFVSIAGIASLVKGMRKFYNTIF